ncbi:MAG TPA: hypothetical protein VJ742_12210 [Nitrososphaera sp.]|nr:hypothetical protein [Nitrososphaera sp.]
MASEELIAHWKKEYGSIYSAPGGKQNYIFRALTIGEHSDILRTYQSVVDIEENIVRCALLEPRDLTAKTPAGVVSTLAEEIMEVSGFGSYDHAKSLLESKRAASNSVPVLMKAFILATMPAYTEEELNNLSFEQMAAKVALAEQIIKVQQAVVGIEGEVILQLLDVQEEARKQAAEEERKAQKAREQMDRFVQKGFADPDEPPPVRQKIDPEDPIARKLRESLGG